MASEWFKKAGAARCRVMGKNFNLAIKKTGVQWRSIHRAFVHGVFVKKVFVLKLAGKWFYALRRVSLEFSSRIRQGLGLRPFVPVQGGKILIGKILIRMLLVLALLFYLPGAGFFTSARKQAVPEAFPEGVENGVGGGALPEEPWLQPEADLELSGIPEPDEYSKPHILTFGAYTLEKGDIIGDIAVRTGLNEDTLISVNNVKNTRLLQIGQVLRIPNQDGIFYTVQTGDTLEGLAEKYSISVSAISTVNELFSDGLQSGTSLFIPGARMDWVNRQEINGDLFIWPCAGYISSNYGYRVNPFNEAVRQFHSGLDIGAYIGAPIKAAMAGRVSHVGYDDSFGNFVILSHHSGYRTLYAHMSVVRAKAGAYVETGERIGDVGVTGATTGPHLHFTVYKNGVTVNPRALMK